MYVYIYIKLLFNAAVLSTQTHTHTKKHRYTYLLVVKQIFFRLPQDEITGNLAISLPSSLKS